MAQRTRNSTGFTLVEILIVVVILGILAAIVIPQFTSASDDAKGASLYTQLQTIRSQLELYQVQHNGDYPTLAQLQDDTNSTDGDWGVMINKTNVDHTFTGTPELGPYLQQPPKNPFANTDVATLVLGSDATPIATDGTAGDLATSGWIYNEDTGQIVASGFNEGTGEKVDSN